MAPFFGLLLRHPVLTIRPHRLDPKRPPSMPSQSPGRRSTALCRRLRSDVRRLAMSVERCDELETLASCPGVEVKLERVDDSGNGGCPWESRNCHYCTSDFGAVTRLVTETESSTKSWLQPAVRVLDEARRHA